MENQEKSIYQINLRSIFITFFQEKWLILFASAILALITFLHSMNTRYAYYTASTEIYIMDNTNSPSYSINYNDFQTAEQLTNDYEQLISNATVLEPVIDKMGLKMSASALKSKISVRAREDTRIIVISVSDSDPYKATDLANNVRIEASEKIVDIMGIDAVNLVSEAKIPLASHTSGPQKATVFAFCFGIFVSFCIVLVRDVLNDTIKSPDEVIDKLGITTLGSIPYDREMHQSALSSIHSHNKKGAKK